MLNKKGEEPVSGAVITVIVLILGFAIVLSYFLFANFTGRVDKEACHQSVIVRATLPSVASSYAPLKCQTDKICITSGFFGGKCKEFANSTGVTNIKVKDTTQVEKVITENMVDCWSMMGQGKVSIFSQYFADRYGIGSVYPSCVVCTRIAFDKQSLEKSGIDLSEMDVLGYMQSRLVPGKDITYYELLGGKLSVEDSIKKNFEIKDLKRGDDNSLQEGEESTSVILDKVTNDDISAQKNSDIQSQELSILFMQISSPTHSGAFGNVLKDAGLAGLGAFAISPVKTSIFAYRSAAAAVANWEIVLPVAVIAGAYQQGSVAWNRAVTAGYCGDISAGDKARDGCSVVRTVNYEPEDVSKYCAVIESIP